MQLGSLRKELNLKVKNPTEGISFCSFRTIPTQEYLLPSTEEEPGGVHKGHICSYLPLEKLISQHCGNTQEIPKPEGFNRDLSRIQIGRQTVHEEPWPRPSTARKAGYSGDGLNGTDKITFPRNAQPSPAFHLPSQFQQQLA